MPEISDFTVVVCGPLNTRGPLAATLERSGARLEPDQGSRGHHYGFTDLRDDPTVGTIAVRHVDLNAVAAVAQKAGWALRMHWDTPDCGVCHGAGKANHGTSGLGTCLHCHGTGRSNQPAPDPGQQLRDELDALRAEIDALKARG